VLCGLGYGGRAGGAAGPPPPVPADFVDPARTAAAFAPVPGSAGERLYRTGDLGRLRPDGCLEYLGRRDFRPRLRGRWVDVDAIEAALLALDDVQSAVVKVCQFPDGGTQLIGYVVPAAGAAPASDALRRRLAGRLPAESLPARFVLLDRLPLNANFKVDRNALPLPDQLRPRLETQFAAPRDPLEQELALIWREILGLDRVGIHDDFFDLGGDSLAALQVAHLIEERIETGLPVSDLLQAPTVALMAERLRAARPATCLVPIQPGGSRTPLFGVHDQSGEVLCFRELAARLAPDRPFYGLRMVAPTAVEESIEAIAARYVEAIRAVQPQGPYLLAGNCFGGVIAFEAARRSPAARELGPVAPPALGDRGSVRRAGAGDPARALATRPGPPAEGRAERPREFGGRAPRPGRPARLPPRRQPVPPATLSRRRDPGADRPRDQPARLGTARPGLPCDRAAAGDAAPGRRRRAPALRRPAGRAAAPRARPRRPLLTGLPRARHAL